MHTIEEVMPPTFLPLLDLWGTSQQLHGKPPNYYGQMSKPNMKMSHPQTILLPVGSSLLAWSLCSTPS
jgi:hypothetical protein